MDEYPPPPPRRIVVLQTTTDILKEATSIFSTHNNFLMLLFLSVVLLILRAHVETNHHFLTSIIDNDPSIKSLIYRIHGPPKPTSPTSTITTRRHHHRRPYLQLTRLGTLDDDFLSGDDELDHRFVGSLPKPQSNASSFILDSLDRRLGISNLVSDNGIRAFETVGSRAKMSFRSIEIIEKEENVVVDEFNNSAAFNETAENKTDFQSFSNRFYFDHHEFTALLFAVGAFSVSYFFMILGSAVTYTTVHWIIFVFVLNVFCTRCNSFAITYRRRNGSYLGLKRLSYFIAIRWIIRDAFTQLLGIWFFGEIEDRYSLLKIFVRYKFMPYSIMSFWVKGFEKEIHGFITTWIFSDLFMSFVFAMYAWIVMADSRRNMREVVKEGFHLLSLMIEPAINLKCFEGVVCGPAARFVLTRHFGVLFALAFQVFMEVYFMVAWVMYYLSVKSIDANIRGQTFGQRELEAMLEDDR